MTSSPGLLVVAVAFLAGCPMGPVPPGGAGTVQFTASGEVLAQRGYDFPSVGSGDPVFVDGWEVRFEEVLVTIDHLALWENPDKSPSDQSRIDEKVAQVDGPWAVDLHLGGPLVGKGGPDERALAIAAVAGQNLKGGEPPFDPQRRYAFGFDVVPASAAARMVNLVDSGAADYALMVSRGWTVLYVGTATWKGGSCTTTNDAYDFTRLVGGEVVSPQRVKFRLGFASPTSYVNCQNPDNDPAAPFADEEHQRGVQIKANAVTVAQVTLHTDHPFWESVVHDAPLHFDPLAAHAVSDGAGGWLVTMDQLQGINHTAFTDGRGAPLPWRSCTTDYAPPNPSMWMGFDDGGLFDPQGDPARNLRDLRDFMTYDQSTQGHLNSDGLCWVRRNYPSPR